MENNNEKINAGIEPQQMPAPETEPVTETKPVAEAEPVTETEPVAAEPVIVAEPAPQEVKRTFCTSCGTALEAGQAFCYNCGAPVAAFVAPKAKKKGAGKLVAIIGAAVAAVAIIVVVLILVIGGNKPDFNEMYGEYANEKWCTIASDGSWMKIDTNPGDVDGDYITDWETVLTGFEKAGEINVELGFDSAMHDEMAETTWRDGLQTRENDDYIVTWTYHPDKGLEVTYTVK